MASVTLSTLRTRARARCDQVNSQFVADSELNAFLNASADELYDILVQKFGDDYYAKSSSFTTAANTPTYDLPADFYKLLGIDLKVAGETLTLERYAFRDRNLYSNSPTLPLGKQYRYRLEGSKIRLTPTPDAGEAGTIWYVPLRTQMSADGDTLDGVSGWEEYVVVDAAIKCVAKEEGDPSVLMAEKAALLRRIESASAHRDAGAPPSVADVWSDTEWS